MHRYSSTADITEWKAVLKAEPWCSLLPQLQTPLLCSALWCANWFDSHFFPPASWILDSAKRGYRKGTVLFRDLSSVWLDWIKTENNDNRNGGKTRSLYMRVSKMEPKTPKVGCQTSNIIRKPQERDQQAVRTPGMKFTFLKNWRKQILHKEKREQSIKIKSQPRLVIQVGR